ncbi:hypothetical protein ORV05_22955 [Amycolatopsis cynarae]|uniref:DUF3558 domain-containing protein n=1 Tax=Amycolatopsis cynarae TaxID=2995223 RepID=A0ABY7AV37_9PSEU|nr:hypothetical protein [Amycolatopsis sp. HUAS 11-8]WAL63840.1 hypothetical protein ORV05_22955 [Amycolatopsis sp. HUAS 11-8]
MDGDLSAVSRSWLFVLLAVCLTACSSPGNSAAPFLHGNVPPSPPAAPPVLTPEQALGDLTTIDYCSLVDLGEASGAGATHIGPVVSSPNKCIAFTTVSGRATAIVVGQLAGKKADPDRAPDVTADKLDQGLRIQIAEYGSDKACRRYLTFADGTHLMVDVGFTDNDSGTVDQRAALCTVEKAVFAGLVTDITARKATHLTFPANSLGTVDPCPLLPDPHVLPGGLAEDLEIIPVPSHHRCTWLDLVHRTDVEFSFDYGRLPTGTKTTIAGLPSVTEPHTLSCKITTDVGASPVPRLHQLASLYVRVPDRGSDACAAAMTLATAAWPKLPTNV